VVLISLTEESADALNLSSQPLGVRLLDHDTGLGAFQEICWQYLHKLPQPFKLGQIKTRIDEEAGAYGGRRYEFDSRIFSGDDRENPVGQLAVTLYRRPRGGTNDIFLELEQCQLWYPALRNKGMGSSILALVKGLGQELGVKAITTIAIYDGRFVWPMLGFRFGDYLPDENAAQKYRRRFLKFCARHHLTPPDVSAWDASDLARFATDYHLPATMGHRMDQRRKMVNFGRAFLLSRRPFFLSYPLEQSQVITEAEAQLATTRL
jgi:hypothetical protein